MIGGASPGGKSAACRAERRRDARRMLVSTVPCGLRRVPPTALRRGVAENK